MDRFKLRESSAQLKSLLGSTSGATRVQVYRANPIQLELIFTHTAGMELTSW